MTDLGKLGVIAAIMGAILLFGVLLQPVERTAQTEPVADVTSSTPVLVEPVSLEMLGPVYSEKAVFQDDTIRIAFDASFTDGKVESRLPFWLHNVSSEPITVLWDRCSMQLPSGNTVNVLNEASLSALVLPGGVISVAPAGDLFDAFIPVTEITWTDSDSALTTGVFDSGTFTLVLAVERGTAAHLLDQCEDAVVGQRSGAIVTGPGGTRTVITTTAPSCDDTREIVFYTFRFVMR